MKRSLVIIPAALAIAGMAQAADRKVSDLMYMPKAGGMLFGTELVYETGDYTNASKDAGDKSSWDYERKSLTWNNSFDYSFTDNLQLGLGLNYQFSSKLKNPAGKSNDGTTALTASQLDAETNDKGLKNVELNARFRAMEEAPVTLDVLAGLAVKLGDDKKSQTYTNASGNKAAEDGNAYNATTLNLGTEVGKKHGDFQWKGSLGLVYGLKHDVYLLKNDTNASGNLVDLKLEQDSYVDVRLGVAGEYHLTSSFALGAKVDYDIVGERKYTTKEVVQPTDATVMTEDSHSNITLGVEGKYEITQAIVGKVGFDYAMKGDKDISFKTGAAAAQKAQDQDRNDMRFALGMDFSF